MTIPAAKIAVSLDQKTVQHLDQLVAQGVFPNRSQAIQQAVQDKLSKLSRDRLALECAKLNPELESRMAEEGMEVEAGQWPEY